MNRKFLGMLALFCMMFVLAACGDTKVSGKFGKGGDGSSHDFVVPDGAVELEPGVYVVPGIHIRPGIEIYELGADFADEIVLDAQSPTVELRGAAAREVAELKVGDILLTDEVVARVASVSRAQGVTTVVLEDFVLWDVIHGEWSLEIELDRDEELYPVSPSDYEIRRQLLSQSVNVGGEYKSGSLKFSANASATATINPVFVFEGKIPFYESKSNYHCSNPQIDTRVLFKRYSYCIDYLKMSIVASNEYKTSAVVTATAEARAEFPDKNNKRVLSKPLGEIPVAGPFSFKPSLYIDSQLAAVAKATVKLDFTSAKGASVPVGFEYRNGSGYSMLPNGANPGTKHSTLSGSITAEGSLEASAYAELGLAMSVCTTGSTIAGACFEGLSAGARLTTKVQYKDSISTTGPNKSACLSMSSDLEVKLTGKAKVGVTAAAGALEKSVLLFEASFTALSLNLSKWDDDGRYCLTEIPHQMRVDMLNDQYDLDIDCKEPDDNPLIGTCAEKFMIHCFDPEGECRGLAYEDGSFDMNWESGERYLSTITKTELVADLIEMPSELLGEYISADGELCAQQDSILAMMSGGEAGCMVTAIIELLLDPEEDQAEEDGEGEEGEYQPKKGDKLELCVYESGDIKYTCPDRTTFMVSNETEGKICQQGTCKFEKGYLDERDENRK